MTAQRVTTEEAERIVETLADLIPRIRGRDEDDLRTLTTALHEAATALRALAAERDALEDHLRWIEGIAKEPDAKWYSAALRSISSRARAALGEEDR